MAISVLAISILAIAAVGLSTVAIRCSAIWLAVAIRLVTEIIRIPLWPTLLILILGTSRLLCRPALGFTVLLTICLATRLAACR